MGISDTDPVSQLSLPPGFRFYPTDEELLVQYLCRKVAGNHFQLQIIGEVDLYKFDPWVLPSKAVFGEKEWYFFSPRDRKYPNGSRPNRVAGSGYWKATGTDKIVMSEGRKIGIKKALVFYVGKAPKGTKTNWIMHEYRLSESPRKKGSSRLDDWVLCRIYKKNWGIQKPDSSVSTKEYSNGSCSSPLSSQFDDAMESLPEIEDRSFALPRMNSLKTLQLQDEKLNFQNLGFGKFDWNDLAVLGSLPELETNSQIQSPENDMQSLPPMCHVESPMETEKIGRSIEEEVESGVGTQRVDNMGLFQQNPNGFAQPFADSLDPFGFRYLTRQVSGRFGYGYGYGCEL